MFMKSFFILVVLALFGCVSASSSYYDVIQWDARSYIESFVSYHGRVAYLKRKASNELWSDQKLEQEVKQLSKESEIIVKIESYSIGSANTKYWELVIQTMDGNEIARAKGYDRIASYYPPNTGYHRGWWNFMLIRINAKYKPPFKLFVIDKLSNTRSQYVFK